MEREEFMVKEHLEEEQKRKAKGEEKRGDANEVKENGQKGEVRLECGKCGATGHDTKDCPHYQGAKEDHEDVWCHFGRENWPAPSRSNQANKIITGRVIKRPGDGSCLYHSLLFCTTDGWPEPHAAQNLRRELADYLQQHPEETIAGSTLSQWVEYAVKEPLESYADRIRERGWGGAIEIACFALKRSVDVFVWEREGDSDNFKCIAEFLTDASTDLKEKMPTANIIYQGRAHYDVLEEMEVPANHTESSTDADTTIQNW